MLLALRINTGMNSSADGGNGIFCNSMSLFTANRFVFIIDFIHYWPGYSVGTRLRLLITLPLHTYQVACHTLAFILCQYG